MQTPVCDLVYTMPMHGRKGYRRAAVHTVRGATMEPVRVPGNDGCAERKPDQLTAGGAVHGRNVHGISMEFSRVLCNAVGGNAYITNTVYRSYAHRSCDPWLIAE